MVLSRKIKQRPSKTMPKQTIKYHGFQKFRPKTSFVSLNLPVVFASAGPTSTASDDVVEHSSTWRSLTTALTGKEHLFDF